MIAIPLLLAAASACIQPAVVQEATAYNSWPMVQAVGDRLVCAYSRGSGHTIAEGRRGVWARTSCDRGLTWSDEALVADDPRWGEVTIGKGVADGGGMLLWVRCWGPNPHHDLYRTADGKTFERISSPALDPVPMQITDVIRIPDVGLMSLWFSAGYKPDQDRSWGTLTSADGGRTWVRRTVESGLSREDWPTEPSGVWLGNGRILVVARSEAGSGARQFQLTSADSGRTWTRRRTNIDDVLQSTPSLVFDRKTGQVSNYYYQRGARKLKRRVASAEAVFLDAESWPAPETLFTGREERPYDAGNVNVTELDGRHYAALYTGGPTNAAVLVIPVDAPGLRVPDAGGRRAVTLDPGPTNRFSVSFEVPIADIQQSWTPDRERPLLERKWRISLPSGPQCNMPYLAFFDMAERNVFSFGSESLEWDSLVEAKINQERGVYEMKLTVAAGPEGVLRPFKVTMDRRGIPWTAALKDWRESLSYGKGRYPEAAWRPVYCSWYAVHAAITQDWVDRTAAIAADLGFGTFILDDGWSYDEGKRVNPETIKTWYRDVGKWDAFSSAKFPDFKAHRERMRRLGLRYVVWVAPYFVGTRSEAYRRLGFDRRLGAKPFEGNVLTDITDAKTMDDVIGQLETLLRESDLDGLKIDFLDSVSLSMECPRSAYALSFIERMMERLRAVKPDGLFEFRQHYATPVMARFGTQFRAGDVPFEWLSNLQRLAQIRLTMGDGIPIHADPIYWSDFETDDNVARHFMAAMAGVPMLSMDLARLPKNRLDVIRFWTDFYAKRVEKFQRGGKWDVTYRNGGLSFLTSALGDEILVIVNDTADAPAIARAVEGRKATALNLGFEPLKLPGGIEVGPASFR